MSNLPTIHITTSAVDLPVTKSSVRVRAMNVREEKILLTAKDAGQQEDVLFAINELVKACTYDSLDFARLPGPDVIALFIKIVELSKGPKTVHTYICQNEVEGKKCGGRIDVPVDLREIRFEGGEVDPLVRVQDDIQIELTYPNPELVRQAMADCVAKDEDGNPDEIEAQLRLFAYSIKSVVTNTQIYTEFTKEEAYEWFLGLPDSALANVTKFFEDTPHAILQYVVACPKCGHSETVTLTNIDDFFTQGIPGTA